MPGGTIKAISSAAPSSLRVPGGTIKATVLRPLPSSHGPSPGRIVSTLDPQLAATEPRAPQQERLTHALCVRKAHPAGARRRVQLDTLNVAALQKEIPQIVLARLPRQIAHEARQPPAYVASVARRDEAAASRVSRARSCPHAVDVAIGQPCAPRQGRAGAHKGRRCERGESGLGSARSRGAVHVDGGRPTRRIAGGQHPPDREHIAVRGQQLEQRRAARHARMGHGGRQLLERERRGAQASTVPGRVQAVRGGCRPRRLHGPRGVVGQPRLLAAEREGQLLTARLEPGTGERKESEQRERTTAAWPKGAWVGA